MMVEVAGQSVSIALGGVKPVKGAPAILFIHGAGGNKGAWLPILNLASEAGISILAPELPAHGKSGGRALTSIEEISAWLLELVDVLELGQLHLVGHSQGFLSALEFTATKPDRVLSLTGITSGLQIPVNSQLLELADNDSVKAVEAMAAWSFSKPAKLKQSELEAATASMLAAPLAVDLHCCNNYRNGELAANSVKQQNIRCAMLSAKSDKMTPYSAGEQAARSLGGDIFGFDDQSHMLPMESPHLVWDCLENIVGLKPN